MIEENFQPSSLDDQIMDIFYKAGLEHLIQDDDGFERFCETCQNKAEPMCFATNVMLTVAKHDIKKLLIFKQGILTHETK